MTVRQSISKKLLIIDNPTRYLSNRLFLSLNIVPHFNFYLGSVFQIYIDPKKHKNEIGEMNAHKKKNTEASNISHRKLFILYVRGIWRGAIVHTQLFILWITNAWQYNSNNITAGVLFGFHNVYGICLLRIHAPGRGKRYLLVAVGIEHTCIFCTVGSLVTRYFGLRSGLKLWRGF